MYQIHCSDVQRKPSIKLCFVKGFSDFREGLGWFISEYQELKRSSLSCVHAQSCLTVTPGTVAHQAPLSIGFPRQGCWCGHRVLLQGIVPTQESNPGILCFLLWQVGSLPLEQSEKPQLMQYCSSKLRLKSYAGLGPWIQHSFSVWPCKWKLSEPQFTFLQTWDTKSTS